MAEDGGGDHRQGHGGAARLLGRLPDGIAPAVLFHTLRTISREVTNEKMAVRSGQRDALLTIFSAMAHARSEAVFDEQCTLLTQMDVPAASTYFERNWLPIKREWVACFKVKSFNLGESTNNRLESFNGKLKSVCSRFASLYAFFQDFHSVLRVLRGERKHVSIIGRVSKLSVEADVLTGDDERYRPLTTPYAYHLIVGQMAKRNGVQLAANNDVPVMSSEGPLFVTGSTCDCGFRTANRLPCKHILARHMMQGLSSYDASLVDDRWLASLAGPSSVAVGPLPPSAAPAVLTSHLKYRKAMVLATELASLMSEVGMVQFASRLDVLRQLRDEWSAATITRGAPAVITSVFHANYFFIGSSVYLFVCLFYSGSYHSAAGDDPASDRVGRTGGHDGSDDSDDSDDLTWGSGPHADSVSCSAAG